MAAQDLGSAYARFTLNLADLETKANEAEAILTRLETRTQKPINANIKANVQQVNNQQQQPTGPQQLGFNFNRSRTYPNQPSGNTTAPGAAATVAGALAGAQQATTANDKLVNSAINAAVGEGRLAAAIKLTQQALATQGLSAERINALRARLGQLTARNAAEEDQLAAKLIRNAAAVGNYTEAFSRLSDMRKAAGKDAERIAQTDSLYITVVTAARKAAFDETDALINRAKAQGDLTKALQLTIDAEEQANTVGDKGRASKLVDDATKLRNQIQTQKTTSADKGISDAVGAKDYTTALKLVADELAVVGIAQDRKNALIQRGNAINRTYIQSLNDEAVSSAKLVAASGDIAGAVKVLSLRKLELNKLGIDSAQIEKALVDTLNQETTKNEDIADAEIRRLTIQKELQAALDKTRDAIKVAPAGPAGDTRRADLSVTEANLIALQAQAQAKLAASTSNLQRQQKLYGDAIDTLSIQQKNYIKDSTAWNILEAQKIAILKQATGETNKDADAQIRAAKAAHDWQLAQKLLNDELAKAAAAGDTRRVANLNAQLSQLNRTVAANSAWASFKQGLLGIVAPLSAANLVTAAFQKTLETLKDSLKISGEMDLNGRALGAFFGNVGRGTRTLQDAEEFARRYKLEFNEVGEAAQSAGLLLKNSFVSTDQTLTVLARLQQRAPNKNFQDAVRSVVELQSGQLQSLERVFNIPQKYAQQLAQDLKAGQDPILALDNLLNKLGNTEATLVERTKGLAGAQNSLSSAWSEFKKDLGDLLSGPATAFLSWLARAASGAAALARGIKGIPKVIVNPQDQLSAGQKFLNLEGNQLKNGGIISKAAALTVPGMFVNLFKAFAGQGEEANARVDAALRRTIKTTQEMRDELVKTNPVLAQFLPKSDARRLAYEKQQAQASVKGADSIDQIIDKLNTVNSQYDEGTKNAYEMANAAAEITKNVKASPDTFAFLTQLKKDYPNAKDQLEKLQELRQQLSLASGTAATDQEKVQIVADYTAVTRAIADIEGQSPIIVDVKFRVALDNEIAKTSQSILDATSKLMTDRESLYKEHSGKIKELEDSIYSAGESYRKANGRAVRDFEAGQLKNAEDFGRQRAQTYKDFNTAQNEQEYDFNQQRLRAVRDFGQQQLRAQRDFAQQQERSDRDFAHNRLRQLRDFAKSEQRSDEDRAFQQARTQRDRNQEDLRSERDHLRDMQNARRDFDIGNARSLEDYNDQRIKLLAEGRIKEAQLLGKQFNRDQGRRNEDFVRNRSDSVDSYGQTKADRDQDRKRQDADAKEDSDRARIRRLADFKQSQADAAEDHEQQRKDAAAAFKQQQDDAKIAFAQQQKDADDAHALQVQRTKDHFKEQMDLALADFIRQRDDAKAAFKQQRQDASDDFVLQIAAINKNIRDENTAYDTKYADLKTKYNDFIAAQKTAFNEFVREQARIRELEQGHMDTDEATAIAKMETTNRALQKLGIDQSAVTQESGYNAGLAWVTGLSKALSDFAKRGVDPTLKELNDKIAGHSPPPQGPLKDVDKGGYNVGRAWSKGFNDGMIHDQLDSLRKYADTQQRFIDYSRSKFGGSGASAGADGNAAGRSLTLTVPVAISLDGRVVGQVVAPHVAGAFMEDLSVAVHVVDASQNMAHTQTGFRGNPSTTRS